MSDGFAQIKRFLREASGLAIEDDKRYFIEARLRPVLRANGLADLDALALALRRDRVSDLARTVAETLTINETSFFRDRSLFAALADRLLPQLFATRAETRRLRIWCAGCSTGQEPYSVAMVVEDALRQHPGWRVEILATDLSRAAIEQAQRGVYSQFEVQRGLPVMLLLRHFIRRNDVWQVNEGLRSRVAFKVANLLAIQHEAASFDLVFCRNVLFYFDAECRRTVLLRLAQVLAGDGMVVLGGAERVVSASPLLRADPTTSFVLVRVPTAPAGGRPDFAA